MTATQILDSLRRARDSEHAWRAAALDIGALLTTGPEHELDALLGGLGAFPAGEQAWFRGARQMLLDLLSGRVQAHAVAQQEAESDEELQRVAANETWKRVAAAIVRAGGVARHRDLVAALSMDRGQLTRVLDAMLDAGMLRPVPLEKGDAVNARLCALSREGRRLVERSIGVSPQVQSQNAFSALPPSTERARGKARALDRKLKIQDAPIGGNEARG